MYYKKTKLLSWNVKGLGNPDKCNVVKDVIRTSRCDVCLLQETKMNEVTLNYVWRFLPSFFNPCCAFSEANHSKGGIIIAWKKSYEMESSWATRHALSVLLNHVKSGNKMVVTAVYGPSVDSEKEDFIKELYHMASLIEFPWIMAGDFNLVRWLIDRSGSLRGFRLMDLFNEFIQKYGLVDIQLRNRLYTWSSKRPKPIFSKLDRVLVSSDIQLNYPVISLEALEMVVSDHVPILLSCKNMVPQPRRLRLETFWFDYGMPGVMVQQLWAHQEANPQMKLQGFTQKTLTLNRALVLWHKEKFAQMDVQLTYCKRVILFFDKIEEHRELSRHEFLLRNKIRERAYQLANNVEKRWQQRARCKWLSQGDKNTAYFHAYASSRMRRNMVRSLIHEGQATSNPNRIQELFTDQLVAGLGTSNNILSFDPGVLYQKDQRLQCLADPICDNEIEGAIRGLAKNKASGPDGIPNEFVQRYWQDLKEEVGAIVKGFFNNQIDISDINRANVVMIPKTNAPLMVGEFRPISIINIIPKIISKILANRLRVLMPDLISPYQTAFIRGRQITDNFVATREILHHISDTNRPAVFIKLDFAKAFDSIEWEFLTRVMEVRGFSTQWITWINSILYTASSRVLINGEVGEYFRHKRGLQQGDPLSPMLFNIAADVLQQMIKAVNKSLSNGLTRKIKDSMLALQYADDTAVIASADISTLVSFKMIMRLYASISGLRINYKKSMFVPLNIQEGDREWIRSVLGCGQSNFPIQYLGMPLTIVKPTKAMYMPHS